MMFKGLHQKLHKAAVKDTPKHPHANPIDSAQTLLGFTKRQEHLKKIKSMLHLPPKLYDSLYLHAIERFAEFVQNLPETLQGIFGHSGGFLDHGLERTVRSLELVLSRFFPESKNFDDASSEQALWIYAVFTASLLLDLGKLAVKYQITLCEKDGLTLKEWLPYSGSMVSQAKYFKFTYIKENRDNLRKLVNPLLARQLLTEQDDSSTGDTTIGGFNWIASNPVVLEAWLSLLQGDTRNMSTYLQVIPLAEAQILDNARAAYISKNSIFNSGLFDPAGTEENITQPDLKAADAFENWLRDKLEKGALSVNEKDSLIHRAEDALLISPELFDKFIQENSQFTNADTVISQFGQKIEIYSDSFGKTGQNYSLVQGEAIKKLQNWLAIHNPGYLFAFGVDPRVNPAVIAQSSYAPKATTAFDQQFTKVKQNVQLQHR